MIVINGKEIKPEKVTMLINIISFFIGVIFYADVMYKITNPQTIIVPGNKAQDSLLVINSRLHSEMSELKAKQDTILFELRNNQTKQATAEKKEVTQRKKIYSTIHSDWEELSTQEKNNYTNQLLTRLKKQKP